MAYTGFGHTARTDAWWLRPLLIFAGLTAFIIYTTWAAFQGDHYAFGPYLSPYYSPEIFGGSPHSWFGPQPSWWPAALTFSPAFLILWGPAGMRFTCYYYRGSYYKAFWADPPACAVSEPRKTYKGEHSFPLIMQNIHRYFFYPAAAFVIILAFDAYKAMWFVEPATGEKSFGIGVGTLVLVLNATLLGCYTFGCHSARHLVGGFLDQLSKSPVHKKAYDCVSCLNKKHSTWAWLSLFCVAFADIYVRMLSMGVWTDWRIF